MAGLGQSEDELSHTRDSSHECHANIFHLLRGRRMEVLGLTIVGVFVLVSILAPLIAPFDPREGDLKRRLEGPTRLHVLGTDELGRDILSRLMFGARITLVIGVLAVLVAAVLGVTIGAIAAYFGGRTDLMLMRLVDIMMTIPEIILAIAMVSVLGTTVACLVVAVGVAATPAFARLCRGTMLVIRQQDYVSAAHAAGASSSRIIIRHMLPNALAPIIVQASLGIGSSILTAASLGFLGLGIQPPTPEWGSMLSRARSYLSYAPHVIIFPGIAIAVLVLGFNLLGDGLRDALDPTLRRSAG